MNNRALAHAKAEEFGTQGSMMENMDEIDMQTRESMKQPTKLDYMRKDQKEAKLEDFLIKKMIGKGSFGKVFLVENKND